MMSTKEFEKKAGFVVIGLILLFWGTVNACSNFNEFQIQEVAIRSSSIILAILIFGIGPAVIGIVLVLKGMSPTKNSGPDQVAAKTDVVVAKPRKTKKKKK